MIRGLNGLLYQWMVGKGKNTEKANLQLSTALLSLSLCLYVCTLFNATVLNVVAEVFSRLTISARGCSTNIVVRRDS